MSDRITTPAPKHPPFARGEGSIYETGRRAGTRPGAPRRWRGSLITRDPRTGQQTRHFVSGKTYEQVDKKLADLRREIEAKGRPSPRTTVAAYLTDWIAARRDRVSPATWRECERHVRSYIVPSIGGLRLADLRASDVDRLLAGIGRAGHPMTAHHVRSTLRRALYDAQRDGLVQINAASLARAPRVERREMRVLTASETAQLLAGTADDDAGPAIAIAATTGLRRGELLGLSWRDVTDLDGPRPTLTVRRSMARAPEGGFELAETKTDKSRRTLMLGATAVRALRVQRARQEMARRVAGELWQNRDNLILTDVLGRPLPGRVLTAAFAAALARLGLPRVRLHDLRHGVASLLLGQGVPMKLVSEQLGHSTVVLTLDTYSHVSREQRQQTADAIERALGGG